MFNFFIICYVRLAIHMPMNPGMAASLRAAAVIGCLCGCLL